MKLQLNREFARRHLFVAVVMVAMGGWFGYDGYVNYPKQDDAYFEVRHLKRDVAIERQKQFMCLAFLAAIIVGGHLWKVSKFAFEFDADGFTVGGKKYAYSDIGNVDRSLWEKKNIAVLALKDGTKVKLDAWHHVGVKEFVKGLA